MRFAKTSSVAAALMLGVVSLLSSATSASAYPAGQNLSLNLAQSSVTVPGTVIHASVTHVKAGCVVTVRILETESTGRYLTAAVNNTVADFTIQTPSAYGVYHVKASTSSACVGYKESDVATLNVGKPTTLTANLASHGGSTVASIRRVFDVTGTMKFGAVNVKNAIVWAQITLPGGSKTARYQTRTNSSGAYAFSISGQGAAKGDYVAKVSFSGAGAYLPSVATSNTVTLH